MKRLTRSSGFTLIEAIVALTLVSLAGMALFSWINTSLQSLAKVEEVNAKNTAMINSLEYMRSVNPMLRRNGSVKLDGYHINWESEALTSEHEAQSSLYLVALYKVNVSAYLANNAKWFEYEIKLPGYKKIREIGNAFQ